jgi:hypothetical protein
MSQREQIQVLAERATAMEARRAAIPNQFSLSLAMPRMAPTRPESALATAIQLFFVEDRTKLSKPPSNCHFGRPAATFPN